MGSLEYHFIYFIKSNAGYCLQVEVSYDAIFSVGCGQTKSLKKISYFHVALMGEFTG
jgi:hypothetical protein